MKITKAYLKKLIKEEIAVMDDDDRTNFDKAEVGQFLEVRISDDGSSKMIERLENEGEYKNTRGYMDSFKALVQIVEIAEPGEDY